MHGRPSCPGTCLQALPCECVSCRRSTQAAPGGKQGQLCASHGQPEAQSPHGQSAGVHHELLSDNETASSSCSDWDVSSSKGADSDSDDDLLTGQRMPTRSRAALQKGQRCQQLRRRGATQHVSVQAATHMEAAHDQGASDAASIRVPLLQPVFRPSTAWQFSASNLLRLRHTCSKRCFKPVAKPEVLLKAPVVTAKQLFDTARCQEPNVGAISTTCGMHMAAKMQQSQLFEHA